MLQAIYTGRMGLTAQQQRLDIVANNVANVNTMGYKTNRADFKDALYDTMKKPIKPQDDVNLELGTGVMTDTTRIFTQGAPIMTGSDLDMTIYGDGFFVIENAQGDLQYSRNGVMHLSVEDDGSQYLISSQSYYILDQNGERIPMTDDMLQKLSVSKEGFLSLGMEAPFAKLAVVSFDNLEGLSAVGQNAFVPTETSGPPEPTEAYEIIQGYLENSNVDLAVEMVRLIRAQRAYQLSARVVTTTDSMENTAISIRG